MATNINLLRKGLKYLGILILLFILSPIALSISFKALAIYDEGNQYVMSVGFLILSCLLTLFTVFFAIKTFSILLKAIFDTD